MQLCLSLCVFCSLEFIYNVNYLFMSHVNLVVIQLYLLQLLHMSLLVVAFNVYVLPVCLSSFISLCLSLSFFVSFCPSFSLSVYLYRSAWVPGRLSTCLMICSHVVSSHPSSPVHLSAYRSIYLCIYLPLLTIYLADRLSTCLRIVLFYLSAHS